MIPYFVVDYFEIGAFKIYTWGFFIAVAFLVGLILAGKEGKKLNIEFKKIIWLVIFIYLGAMIGSRLFFVLQSPKEFLASPSEFFEISAGGLMFYGGLFGGILAGWLYIRKWENRWQFIGALTPIIPLALAIGRIGCFLNNDHLGAQTSLPWAIRWPGDILRHPVALYLILFDLALAGFLWWMSGRHSETRSNEESLASARRTSPAYTRLAEASGEAPAGDSSGGFFADGKKSAFRMTNTFVIFLFFYPLGRFLLDFTRDPSADPHYLGLAVSQWISLSLLTALILYVILKNRRGKKFFAKKETN